jgi:C-terminal processing protease CtpA/Prc
VPRGGGKMNRMFKQVILVFTMIILLLSLSSCTKPLDEKGQIDNIKTFTRLYGYVKYFYPGDEAASIDWEKFAIYGTKYVEKAANQSQLKQKLEELFLPIAPALVIHKSSEKKEFSKMTITPPDTQEMKVISWQHRGVGLSARSVYKSIRLNRKTKFKMGNSFGNISSSINATPYRGKDIKISSAIKVKEGNGQMWLRVDGAKRGSGFFDNMNDRPATENEWKYYEIIGDISKDAKTLNFGSFLKGSGQLWVDDFKIWIKDKESKDWQLVTIKNPSFEKGTAGKFPEQWTSNSKEYTIKVTTETAMEGKQSIQITPLTESKVIAEPLFEKKAAFGEYIAKEIGSGLSCIMPLALYGTETDTFPKAVQEKYAQLKAAIKASVPKKISGDNIYVRLGDITIAWNVFQHFYPYFDIAKTNWLAELPKALKSAYKDKTEFQFMFTLKKLVAALKDGHGRAGLRKNNDLNFLCPIAWDIIEDKLVITKVLDKELKNLKPGDVVTKIDGNDTKEFIEYKKQFIAAATEGWMRYRLKIDLNHGAKDTEIKLTVLRDGKESEIVLKRSMDRRKYYGLLISKKKSKKIEEGIYYLNLDQIPMKEITAMMPKLVKAKAIICDLRGYPKGNHDIISHLLKENDTTKDWMRVPQLIYPDYEKPVFKNYGWEMEASKPHLNAKIIFITGGGAISYAESFMGYIEHYKLATIIGQPTAGTNGNVNTLSLPGDYYITWTGMRVVKHDGSQHHGVGILPNIPMDYTIKGIKEGRDELMEKAIEVAKE